MKIKRFDGRTWDEALAKVRAELGPDAVILHTKLPQERSLLRLWGGGKCEILAGIGFEVIRKYPSKRPSSGRTPTPLPIPLPKGEARVRLPAPPRPAARPSPAPAASISSGPAESPLLPAGSGYRELKQLVSDLRDQMHFSASENYLGTAPEGVRAGYRGMVENRISETLARKVIEGVRQNLNPEACRNPVVVREAIRRTIGEMIPAAHEIHLTPGKCRTVALIGPTGVGKTTTLAKLAAIHTLRRKRVGLVTMDTYRIAATHQLAEMAKLMNLPLRIAHTPAQVHEALELFSRFDLVLIDSAGRAPRNAEHLDELRQFLDVAKPDEIHLVLSMASDAEVMRDAAERFAACRIDKLILTKLDEGVRFGLILDVLERVRTSISYVTTGQRVPQDIEPASREKLVGMICGAEVEHGSGGRAATAG